MKRTVTMVKHNSPVIDKETVTDTVGVRGNSKWTAVVVQRNPQWFGTTREEHTLLELRGDLIMARVSHALRLGSAAGECI
ncbi:hypothetical protein ACOSP7_017128 [Xanthoceras sorbifolium]